MQPVPSRQALRHLARMCHNADSGPFCARRNLTFNALHGHSRAQTNTLCASKIRGKHVNCYKSTARAFSATSSAQTEQKSTTRSTSTSTSTSRNTTTPLPDITNYYTLFPNTLPKGPPTPSSNSSFSISLPSLRREFLSLQSLHHPDKYDPATKAHQKALALSSLINNAYKTLSDPLLRAQYVLLLEYDVDVTSEDNSAHPTDQDTLMEVMEAQERIEEASDQTEIDQLMQENDVRIKDTEQKMGEAFERGEVDNAKNECVRLKYWKSLQQGLRDWEPGKDVRLVH